MLHPAWPVATPLMRSLLLIINIILSINDIHLLICCIRQLELRNLECKNFRRKSQYQYASDPLLAEKSEYCDHNHSTAASLVLLLNHSSCFRVLQEYMYRLPDLLQMRCRAVLNNFFLLLSRSGLQTATVLSCIIS